LLSILKKCYWWIHSSTNIVDRKTKVFLLPIVDDLALTSIKSFEYICKRSSIIHSLDYFCFAKCRNITLRRMKSFNTHHRIFILSALRSILAIKRRSSYLMFFNVGSYSSSLFCLFIFWCFIFIFIFSSFANFISIVVIVIILVDTIYESK